MQLFWKRTDQNTFSKSQRYFHCWGPIEGWLTVWVYATLDQIAITLPPSHADWPKSLARVVLLVPEDSLSSEPFRLERVQ
jgi:hypothetical protein